MIRSILCIVFILSLPATSHGGRDQAASDAEDARFYARQGQDARSLESAQYYARKAQSAANDARSEAEGARLGATAGYADDASKYANRARTATSQDSANYFLRRARDSAQMAEDAANATSSMGVSPFAAVKTRATNTTEKKIWTPTNSAQVFAPTEIIDLGEPAWDDAERRYGDGY